jgi:hypothetical protein
MPGKWNVTQRAEELDPYSSSSSSSFEKTPEMPWNCVVLEGQKTRFDLGADAAAPCVLTGRLNVRGAETGAWNAVFLGGVGQAKAVLLDPSGAFRLERIQPGDVRMVLTAVTGPLEGTRVMAPLSLPLGETRWSAEVDTAKLALRGPGSGSKAPLVLIVTRDDNSFLVRPLPDAGDVEVVIPAGKGRILRMDEHSMPSPDPRQWLGGTEITIDAGTTVRVDRP